MWGSFWSDIRVLGKKKNLDASLEKEKVENKLHFFARRFYNHANGNVEATQPVRVESIN